MAEFYDDVIDGPTASILLEGLVEMPEDLQDYAVLPTEVITEESK